MSHLLEPDLCPNAAGDYRASGDDLRVFCDQHVVAGHCDLLAAAHVLRIASSVLLWHAGLYEWSCAN